MTYMLGGKQYLVVAASDEPLTKRRANPVELAFGLRGSVSEIRLAHIESDFRFGVIKDIRTPRRRQNVPKSQLLKHYLAKPCIRPVGDSDLPNDLTFAPACVHRIQQFVLCDFLAKVVTYGLACT